MAKLLRDAKGRFVTAGVKEALTKKSSRTKQLSDKAKSQPRDAKGHFIKQAVTIAVDPGTQDTTCISVVTTPKGTVDDNVWAKTMAEVSAKLNVVIQGLDKLADFKDYITGKKSSK